MPGPMVIGTAANVPEMKAIVEPLRGEEDEVYCDKSYTTKAGNLSVSNPKHGPLWCFPHKRHSGEDASEWKREINIRLFRLRARVEHPVRVIKNRFGAAMVRHSGLAKKTAADHIVGAVESASEEAAVAGCGLNVPGDRWMPTE